MDRRDSQAPPLTDDLPTCEPGTLLGGRYRLVAQVSRGSFTEIWRAHDDVLGRTVAAKILLPEHVADGAVKRLFRVEALSAARLTHSNIVAVFDTGEHLGAPYVVMEYLAGGNLRQLIEKGSIPWERAAQLGLEICAALGHAHAAGIIHRDVRPENVLFTESGHLKVSDFGIANAQMAARSPAHPPVERDSYVSPEQSIDLEPDARADVYSVGAVLYACVTGKSPSEALAQQGDDTASLTQMPPPSTLQPEISRTLDETIMKAMAIDPAKRYADAMVLGKTIRALLPGSTSMGHAPNERAIKPRNPPAAPPTVQSAAATPRTPETEASIGRSAAVAPSSARSAPATPKPAGRVEDESFIRSEGRWMLPTLLVMVAAAAIVLAIPSVRDRIEQFVPIPGNVGQPIAVQQFGAYDPPPGDGEENSDSVGLAFDSDTQTAWSTSSYATADFGRLKPGVGIYFDLGEPTELGGISVQSRTGGWQGTIRTSEDGRNWTEPGSPQTARAEHTFETSGSHRYWMLWVTELTRTPGEGTAEHPFAVAIEQVEPLGP